MLPERERSGYEVEGSFVFAQDTASGPELASAGSALSLSKGGFLPRNRAV